jgi:hypothetical protein
MGIAPAQDSHPGFAKIVAGIWPVFSIVDWAHVSLEAGSQRDDYANQRSGLFSQAGFAT